MTAYRSTPASIHSVSHPPGKAFHAPEPEVSQFRSVVVRHLLAIALRMLLLAVIFMSGRSVHAQLPPPAAPAKPAAPAAAKPPAAPEPIPLADVASQALSTQLRIRQLVGSGTADRLLDAAAEDIPVLSREAGFRYREAQQALSSNVSIDSIRRLQDDWRDIQQRAFAITRDLTRRAAQIDRNLKDLDGIGETWKATARAAGEAAAPREVLSRIADINEQIAQARKELLDQRARVLGLQKNASDIDARAAEMRQALIEAAERVVTGLLYRDSLPLWSPAFWAGGVGSFSSEAKARIQNERDALAEYVSDHQGNFFLHGLLFVILASMLVAVRRHVLRCEDKDEYPWRARRIFDMPMASALLISTFLGTWIYPGSIRALWIIISIVAAAPALIFIRRMMSEALRVPLYLVIGFYVANQLRGIVGPFPGISRLVLLAEGIAGIAFILPVLRRAKRAHAMPEPENAGMLRLLLVLAGTAFAVALVTVACNIAGYTRLAELATRMLVSSAYLAVVLYALTCVVEGILQVVLRAPPLSRFAMVRRHRPLLARRLGQWLRWAGLLLWIAMTLQIPGLFQPFMSLAASMWDAGFGIGSLSLRVGGVLSFFIIIWAAFLLSRFARFLLEEGVYPSIRLDRGLPYAISMMVHYLILLTGLVLALGAIGVDMTKITIVAGALSVGIGFGLQNIVNNFVSGLIVLFERPIKVGDTIQIDDITGRVEHIGIRASMIRSTMGAEVIIPNGKLISDKVVNWTLENQVRQIVIPLTTRPDVDVEQMKETMLDVARRNAAVLDIPPPEALIVRRSFDTFEFELRVWCRNQDDWLRIRSDLITDLDRALHK